MNLLPRPHLALFAMILATATVHAAEWRIDPLLEFRAGYNDNLRLSVDDEVSTAEISFSPGAEFSRSTAVSRVSGTIDFDFRRYADSNDLDENNSRFALDANRDLERHRLGISLQHINDTTLDSQLDATGITLGRVDRRQSSIAPRWSYMLTERARVQLTYRFNDVAYKNTGRSAYVDFTANYAEASLNAAVDEKTLLTAILSYSTTSNDNDIESAIANLQAGASYRFSETLSLTTFAGVRHTKVKYSRDSFVPILSGNTIIGVVPISEDISSGEWGYTFNVQLSRSFLRGNMDLGASQSISTDVNGQPIEVLQVSTGGSYHLSETLTTGLNLRYSSSKTESTISRSLDRNYYTIEPRLTWQLKKFWRMSASYRYRSQSFDDLKENATQNAAYLTLAYRWPRIAVSR